MKRRVDGIEHTVGDSLLVLITFLLLAVPVYALGYMILSPKFGVGAKALLMLLTIGAAWLGGMRVGLFVSLLTLPLDWTIGYLNGESSGNELVSIPWLIVCTIVGVLVGRMRELEKKLNCQLAEREHVEALMRESETCYRLLFESNPHPMWVFDRETLRFLAVNEATIRHYGYSAEEFSAMTVKDLFLAEEIPAFLIDFSRLLAKHSHVCEWHQRRKDGTMFDVELTALHIPFQGRRGRLISVDDITERKRAQEKLRYQVLHDALTGLPNRVLLQEHLDQSIAAAKRKQGSFALLLLDLDYFKDINDALGHHFGDIVLQELNPRFRAALRAVDIIARLGGDEFAVILPEADELGAIEAAQRMLASLHEPFVLEGQSFTLGASVGIAIYPQHGNDAATLLRLADVAMYKAKRGTGGIAVYSSDRNHETPRRLVLVAELRRGIECDQLLLHYQPKLDLKTMRVRSAEALVRWMHPRDGMMTPAQFIPLAEHSGLIKPLNLWVLNTALLQCRVWRRAGLNLDVAVNLPIANLQDPQLAGTIARLLEDNDSIPSWLTVEITESTMMSEPVQTATVLNQLHEMGVKVSIDDFGTGHSSLAYLKDFPIDEVKIDRSFIKEMAVDKDAAAIVRSVIDLGHTMELKVVAEGVENKETLDLLESFGCDLAQGYYFCYPLPPGEFTDWLCRTFSRLALAK